MINLNYPCVVVICESNMNTKHTSSQAKVNAFQATKNNQPLTLIQTQTQTSTRNQAKRGEAYVPDDLECTMCGLEHWYKNCSMQIGALAGMSLDHPNRLHFVDHIKFSLARLAKAITLRHECGLIPKEQQYDLKIMLRHVDSMSESVARLG